jgi:uncharacterized protein YjbI with pentapeptide repeats
MIRGFGTIQKATLAVILLATLLSARESHALRCMIRSPEEALRRYDVIFTGDALSMESPAASAQQASPEAYILGKWRVRTVWKGPTVTRAEVQHHVWGEPAVWPAHVPLPKDQLVLVSIDNNGHWTKSICSIVPTGTALEKFMELLRAYKARAEALELLTAASPKNAAHWRERARFLEEYGDTRGAVAALTRVTELTPSDADAFVGLARNLLAIDRFDETAEAAGKALALAPDDAQAKRLRDHALIKAGRSGEVDLALVDFSGFHNTVRMRPLPLDLSGLKMDGGHFVGAEFQKVGLAGGSLRGANLREVRFNNVNLAGADLSRANLERSYQYQSDLKNARLESANLREANLFFSNLENADLRQVSAVNAKLERVMLAGARLDGVDFTGALFTQAIAAKTDFADADLSRATLKEADLRGADLSRARLEGAVFTGARFDCETRWPAGFNAVAYGAVPVERDCASRPVKPDYAGATLQHLSLNDLDLAGVSFAKATLSHVQFWNANLEGADFRNALIGADFRGANLRGANFLGAHAFGAQFNGVGGPAADITGAVFRGVRLDARSFVTSHPRMTSVDMATADFRGAIFACINRQTHLGFDPGRYNALMDRRNCTQEYEVTPNLRGVDLRNADWFLADLRNVDLSGADLRGVNLTDADLTGATLDRTDLRGARYDERTVWPAAHDPAVMAKDRGLVFAKIVHVTGSESYITSHWGFRPEGANRPPTLRGAPVPVPDLAGQALDGIDLLAAWLPGSRMDRAALREANLNGANLRGASLQGADLRGATLVRALLEGADLRDARYDGKTVWPAGFDPIAAGARRAD